MFFCEGFWTMCSGRETSFVHGLGDYRDYFLMASLIVKLFSDVIERVYCEIFEISIIHTYEGNSEIPLFRKKF